MSNSIKQRANGKYPYLDELKNDLMSLDRHSKLYKLLKNELSMLGYWRNKQRGNPAKGFKAMDEAKNYD